MDQENADFESSPAAEEPSGNEMNRLPSSPCTDQGEEGLPAPDAPVLPAEENASPPPPLVAPSQESTPPPRSLAIPLSYLFLGMLFLFSVALFEARWTESQPWSTALWTPEGSLQNSECPAEVRAQLVPIWTRLLPAPEQAETQGAQAQFSAYLEGFAKADGVDISIQPKPYLVAAPIPVELFEPLLASGRLPLHGKAEVLAGDLASGESFVVDGVPFEVVGRLKPSVSGFLTNYLMQYSTATSPFFTPESGSTLGWLHPAGLEHLEALLPPKNDSQIKWKEEEAPTLIGGQWRTAPVFAWATLFALMVMAWAGAAFHMRLFARMSTPPTPVFGPLLHATTQYPRLFAGIHVVLYGALFLAMMTGMQFPLLNYFMTEYVSSMFTEGGLDYIGQAYQSGDILSAAMATFYNNYIVQTLLLTFGASVIPVAIGAVKTAMSFWIVGFAMAPTWVGTAAGFTYHSLTMVLELEAYMLAVFVVLLWPVKLITAIRYARFIEVVTGMRIYLGGILLTGTMLAIAALYEALTIILLN